MINLKPPAREIKTFRGNDQPTKPSIAPFKTRIGDYTFLSTHPLSECSLTAKVMCIDAEWKEHILEGTEVPPDVTCKRPRFLIKQYTLDSEDGSRISLVLWDEKFPIPDLSLVPSEMGKVILCLCDLEDVETNIWNVAESLKIGFDKKVVVYMYFSPVDITGCLLNRRIARQVYSSGDLTKKRNINGSIKHPEIPCELIIRDLIGAFNSSLDAAFDLVGTIPNKYKHLIKSEEKGSMDSVMKERPSDLLLYALGDSIYLHDLWKDRVKQINELIKGSLGFNPSFTVDNCPRTMGSLVSSIFNMWLTHEHHDLMLASNVLASVCKSDYGRFKAFKQALKDWDVTENFICHYGDKAMKINPAKPDKIFPGNVKLGGSGSVAGLASGSIRALGGLYDDTARLNAIVQGARCFNEDPSKVSRDDVLDIDLNSCYGSALTRFDFTIGKPRVFGRSQGDDKTTLREFLQKNESELLDNLYQIVVSGDLSFSQDLIYSKVNITPESIVKTLANLDESGDDSEEFNNSLLGWEREVEAAHLGGDFVLMTNQIENGIITSEVLKTLRSVSSDNELNEILKLEVVAAAWYPASQECNPEEMFWHLKTKPGSIFNKEGKRHDQRTEKWCRISLDGFVGKLIAYRRSLKKQKRKKGDEFDVKQNAMKLFINTTYGCLASPYFPMGNVIIANNITAAARVGVWMVSKALGTVQSITDGGAYSNSDVRFFKGVKKPGLDVLSNYRKTNQHRSIKTGELFDFEEIYNGLIDGGKLLTELIKAKKDGLEVEDQLKEVEKSLNDLKDSIDRKATEHINNFWDFYGLKLPFDIEHKHDHICRKLVYFNRADYLFIEPIKADSEINGVPYTIAVRGAKQKNHPKKMLLMFMGGLVDFDDLNIHFEYEQLCGLNEWVDAYKKQHEWVDYCLPGETRIKDTSLKPNLNHLPVANYEEYKRVKSSHDKNVRRYYKRLEESPNAMFGMLNDFSNGLGVERVQRIITNKIDKALKSK